MDDEHDVEGRPVRLVVHADIFTQFATSYGVRHVIMQPVAVPDAVP